MTNAKPDTAAVIKQLDKILELELAGVVRYTHYSFMVQGKDVMLEEYATRMISDETRHAGEVRKMLLPPHD